mmetsp:Transcript_24024/g.56044  ORF Transcript_24024/g.56044 Transcript_24024/m.56044 type:complete len:292 (+) Transcript_24024:275-1150(+)
MREYSIRPSPPWFGCCCCCCFFGICGRNDHFMFAQRTAGMSFCQPGDDAIGMKGMTTRQLTQLFAFLILFNTNGASRLCQVLFRVVVFLQAIFHLGQELQYLRFGQERTFSVVSIQTCQNHPSVSGEISRLNANQQTTQTSQKCKEPTHGRQHPFFGLAVLGARQYRCFAIHSDNQIGLVGCIGSDELFMFLDHSEQFHSGRMRNKQHSNRNAARIRCTHGNQMSLHMIIAYNYILYIGNLHGCARFEFKTATSSTHQQGIWQGSILRGRIGCWIVRDNLFQSSSFIQRFH